MSNHGNANEQPKYLHDVAYSDASSLNTLNICIPSGASSQGGSESRLWIIYIHGGAWRDPKITASSFEKAQSQLLASTQAPFIAGLASLNYRLSPHPDHPSEPEDPARTAKHPDHINDILTALAYLQSEYGFGSNYILAGHSCGATLALQVAMSKQWTSSSSAASAKNALQVPLTDDIQQPIAILGIEGLYDLPAIVADHTDVPIYEAFVKGAFGGQEQDWASVSPTKGRFSESWKNGRLILLAHSHEDEQVEWRQVDLMVEALAAQGWDQIDHRGKLGTKKRAFGVMEVKGKHDEIWEKGDEVAKAILACLDLVTWNS